MAPIVHGLETEYYKEINFTYIDIDDPDNAEFLNILAFRYQPHFLLIDGEGNVIKQWLGPVTAEEFKNTFDTVLQ